MSKAKRWHFVWIGAIGVLMLYLVVSGYVGKPSSADRTIHFVLQSGFNGPFVVTQEDGSPRPIRDGERLIILVPENGRVSLPDVRVLQEWHVLEASFDDGASLPSESDANTSDDQVAIRSLFTTSEGRSWYLIGTYSEKLEYSHEGPPW